MWWYIFLVSELWEAEAEGSSIQAQPITQKHLLHTVLLLQKGRLGILRNFSGRERWDLFPLPFLSIAIKPSNTSKSSFLNMFFISCQHWLLSICIRLIFCCWCFCFLRWFCAVASGGLKLRTLLSQPCVPTPDQYIHLRAHRIKP